jgi:hypothetical protein
VRFLRKKEGRRTYQRRYWAFITGAIVIDHDNEESPSFRWDRDRRAYETRISSSSLGTMTAEPCGTSSSRRTATTGPCRTRTSYSFGGTTIVMGCDSETSSSLMRMRFTLGTSCSLTCGMPNSSFIVSNVISKNSNIPK